ncbi:hypothetical protein P389DRAFT_210619 [Cystobasidium minutum MCA 4210]|uniref:uncharacterized protein n=1 Tax=Cystobasidium minutum MCA 4210 TaxID=1397322 RepID=UPI0034CD81F2|eukprot:jgi/Rhomi1/210619/estExt_Genemark1.C_4_t10175
MEVDNTQVPASDIPKQQQPSPSAVAEATVLPPQEPGEQRRTSSSDVHAQPTIGATKKGEEEAPPSADQQDTAMLTEELPDGSIKASKEPTSTPRVSQISEAELETLYASLESCKKQLMQARQNERRNAGLANSLASMERERDRYRSTVLSLAYQNKVLNDELTRSRKGLSGREEKYVDARLQIQDLKEALALKEREVEELQAARDYVPTSDKDLLDAYYRMREVFDNLRSTLSCSLCYELFKPNDATTLECGHTMCRHCLQQWNDSHIRLYNLATTPDCPECRQPGRHYVKVFLLEEVVRTVDRLERLEAEAEAMKQAERKAALEAERASKASAEPETAHEDEAAGDTDDESAEVSATLLAK